MSNVNLPELVKAPWFLKLTRGLQRAESRARSWGFTTPSSRVLTSINIKDPVQ